MLMPNFLIIGAQKAGTSALYNYLCQHPQIYMSIRKELHFFSFEGEDSKFIQRFNPQANNTAIVTDIKQYYKQFQGVSDEKAIGEASPSYLPSKKASERIKFYIPNVKLIAVLRNPAERAYSNFLHCVRSGAEPLDSFAEALQEEEKRIEENWGLLWQYKHQGFYFNQVKRYFDLFDRNQIRIYLYEDFKSSLQIILKDIFNFLEVDNAFVPNTSVRLNSSGLPKNKFLDSFLSNSYVNSIPKQVVPAGMRRLINSIKNKNLVKPDVPIEMYQYLREIYREDILNLQALLQRDLSVWLN